MVGDELWNSGIRGLVEPVGTGWYLLANKYRIPSSGWFACFKLSFAMAILDEGRWDIEVP